MNQDLRFRSQLAEDSDQFVNVRMKCLRLEAQRTHLLKRDIVPLVGDKIFLQAQFASFRSDDSIIRLVCRIGLGLFRQ